MSKRLFQHWPALALVVILGGAAAFLAVAPGGDQAQQLCSPAACYRFERAADADSRERGLSGRDSLCEECAMLFEFEADGRYGFWMRGMRFPLDVIWFDADGVVVHIERGLRPGDEQVRMPARPARSVVELNAGAAEEVALGDRWELP